LKTSRIVTWIKSRKHEADVRFDMAVLDDKAPVDPFMDNLLAPARTGN
jgi:hypothetical protein